MVKVLLSIGRPPSYISFSIPFFVSFMFSVIITSVFYLSSLTIRNHLTPHSSLCYRSLFLFSSSSPSLYPFSYFSPVHYFYFSSLLFLSDTSLTLPYPFFTFFL